MSDIHNTMSELFDSVLLAKLKSGDITAAELRVVLDRLKQVGVSSLPTNENDVGQILKMVQHGLIEDEPDENEEVA